MAVCGDGENKLARQGTNWDDVLSAPMCGFCPIVLCSGRAFSAFTVFR